LLMHDWPGSVFEFVDMIPRLADPAGFGGKAQIQGTRPQTLAYALTDSPAGLAAWIAEKFQTWTDHSGDFETAIARDHLLANVSLYWLTGAIGSSFWPYYDRLHGLGPFPMARPSMSPPATLPSPAKSCVFPARSPREITPTSVTGR
jgi:hypothetical protein